MAVKVSVVIPVYNPGEYIEDCIASLLRQSLPDDEYEAIFVNDGSTDATPARLDALAAEHPHMHVIHQEPSGWSGKPRNVGIAAAQGEFVMFVDNDDWIGDEALERMYDYGVANEADVILGKMAGKGRPVPLALFRANQPRMSVRNSGLIGSLTPHKMFRKEFLDRHNLRFKEGRRRLEDHVFVAEAYLLASNVSVLSDYLCYYHIKRDDASNAGFQRFDPVGYFTNLREALDVVDRHTEPGSVRDMLHRRWLRNEMVERLRGQRLLSLPEDYRAELFTEIRKVTEERFGPGVMGGMSPIQRAVVQLIVADKLPELEKLAESEAQMRPVGRLEGLAWEDEKLKVDFTAEYTFEDKPLPFRREDDGDHLDLFTELGADVAFALDRSSVDLVVRERTTAAEFYQPCQLTRVREENEDGSFRFFLRAQATVDPETGANGAPLSSSIWDVFLRVNIAAWAKTARLGSLHPDSVTNSRRGSLTGSPRRLVLPYWTEGPGNLSLDVDHATSKFDREVQGITPQDVTLDGRSIALPLRLDPAGTEAVKVRFKSPADGRSFEADASLEPGDEAAVLSAELPAEGLAGRRVRIELGLPSAKRGAPRWTVLPVGLEVAADGTAKVVTTASVDGAATASKAATKAARTARQAAPRKRSLLRRVAGRIKRTLVK
ncbi:glycosyltransferase family 2 protein [Streptomyces beijiangensis]|uniref:Glycosyltransferase n=1 Tax=Streptomyces beijiangensis TaxID=163361 RepID=A0A939F6A9_9ACTN|nr:glycosyltransferase [Streptomyces beijiangensis]MBO0513130.1 glycosyltransferase [Streptomyces beijiangensis]